MLALPSDSLSFCATLAAGSRVADLGCNGWLLAPLIESRGLDLLGVDTAKPSSVPHGARFSDLSDWLSGAHESSMDAIIASHVLEHVANPSDLMIPATRNLKPGGWFWIETPSELSLIPSGVESDRLHEFASFWDDPTHVRPHTPGSLYRLLIAHRLVPLGVGRCVSKGIACSRALGRKPLISHGDAYRYVTLPNVEATVSAAWERVWAEPLPSFEP